MSHFILELRKQKLGALAPSLDGEFVFNPNTNMFGTGKRIGDVAPSISDCRSARSAWLLKDLGLGCGERNTLCSIQTLCNFYCGTKKKNRVRLPTYLLADRNNFKSNLVF